MHALDSWCERYRSGTGARQSDRSGLWIKTRSALLYFARSAPRSAHMLCYICIASLLELVRMSKVFQTIAYMLKIYEESPLMSCQGKHVW